jgi:hypothetical protein
VFREENALGKVPAQKLRSRASVPPQPCEAARITRNREEAVSGITLADLKPLLEQFSGEGTVLSCSADLGVGGAFRPNWEGPLKAKADVLWKAVGEDARARRELEENIAAVRRGLEAAASDGTRWAAAFGAARRGFSRVVPLDAPVETDLVLDRSPYLVPLLAAIHRRREYLAAHTDTHRGRIYAATPAGVRLLAELDAEVPQHQHSTGERYGYEQATIARHREDRILHYRKELTRGLEKAWDAGRYAGLILLGEHEVLEHLRSGLPARLAERVVREVPESWYEAPSQVEGKIRSVAADVFAGQEAEVAPGFWDLLRQGEVVTGPRAVLAALQSGQFGAQGHGYLVLGPDPREAVGRCVACRTLGPEPLGRCPKCQAPCAPGNLWEEMLLTALRHGITARFVADRLQLAPYGGVVAVPPKPGQVRKETGA